MREAKAWKGLKSFSKFGLNVYCKSFFTKTSLTNFTLSESESGQSLIMHFSIKNLRWFADNSDDISLGLSAGIGGHSLWGHCLA